MIFRMKGVKPVRAKGRRYYYHRKTGLAFKTDPLADRAAFLAEWQAFEAQAEAMLAKAAAPVALKNLGGLMAAYRHPANPDFKGLKPRTRDDYRDIMDWLAPGKAMMLDEITPEIVLRLRDKAFRQKKRRFANYVVQFLSLLFAWGKPRGWIATNVATDVPKIKRPKGARKVNRPWSDEERTVVFNEAQGGMRRAVALGMFAGLAEGDMVRWPWTGYSGRRIIGTRGKNDAPINVLAHPQLRELLDAVPEAERQGEIVRGVHGRPYSEEGFRTMFFRLIKKLEGEGKVAPGLTYHGLRHTVGKALAESWAGATDRTIGAGIGDKTGAMGKHYSEEANRQGHVDRAYRAAERKMAVEMENQDGKPAGTPPRRKPGKVA